MAEVRSHHQLGESNKEKLTPQMTPGNSRRLESPERAEQVMLGAGAREFDAAKIDRFFEDRTVVVAAQLGLIAHSPQHHTTLRPVLASSRRKISAHIHSKTEICAGLAYFA
eukprot:1998759-Pleurochrysis_carterae.AAC.2